MDDKDIWRERESGNLMIIIGSKIIGPFQVVGGVRFDLISLFNGISTSVVI